MIKRFDICIGLVIFLFSLFVFSRHLSVHGLEYRDDEIFYVQSAQEMIVHNNYLSPTYFGENRFQKPILFYWFIILFYKFFGTSWFSARLVSSILGALTVVMVWHFSKKYFNTRSALLSCLILMTIPLFFRHARNAVPDMALNFFIVLALCIGYEFIHHPEKQKYRMWFFIVCAMGFMVKGIAAIFIPMMTLLIYGFLTGKGENLRKFHFLKGLFIFLLITLPWFIYMIMYHGNEYAHYMLVKETKDRIVWGSGALANLGIIISTFVQHLVFYLKVILNYFAPWSILFFLSILIILKDIKKGVEELNVLLFLMTWIIVVYLSFSSMKFMINHYMMVITVPFAIFVSYFLLRLFDAQSVWGKFLGVFRKWFLIFIFSIGFFAFIFLNIFLLELNKSFGFAFMIVYVILSYLLIRSESLSFRPVVLSFFILFLFSQPQLLSKAGITSHAVLERFAKMIIESKNKDYVVAVGSNDIHEKEFQVYFNRPVIKAATSVDHETRGMLVRLFKENEEVFCLMIKEDYEVFLTNKEYTDPMYIVKTELMMRRRLRLDRDFMTAIFKLDQKRIQDYLKQEVVLVSKNKRI